MKSSWLARLLGQKVFDVMIRADRTTLKGKALEFAGRRLRQFLIKAVDPQIVFSPGSRNLVLPLSHELPFYLRDYPDYGRNLARIASEVARSGPEMTFIDVGANVGDTVFLLRELARYPILCIEPHAEYRRLLIRNVHQLGQVAVSGALIDEAPGTLRGRLTANRGTAHWATDDVASIHQTTTLTDLLEESPNFAHPRMIKVDTDGMDARVLLGAMDVIRRSKPVLYFEYDPDLAAGHGSDLPGLMMALSSVGYQTVLVYENSGHYLQSLRLNDTEALVDLHAAFSGWRGARYADLCVFHRDDEDLARRIRDSERIRAGSRRGARA